MFKHAARTTATSESIAAADEAEITNIELQLSSSDLLDWEATARIADTSRYQYTVKFPTSLELSAEALQNCVKLCAVLNAETVVMHEPMHRRYGRQLAELAPNLTIAVENNRQSRDQLQAWAQAHDALTLDVEHFWKFTLGDAPLETLTSELTTFLNEFGHKVEHIHLTGYQPALPVHRPMYCNRDMVFAVLSLLADVDFDGCVVSEVSPEYFNRRDLVMDSLLIDSWKEQNAPVVAA